MTIIVANTSNTNTFQYWLTRTNELADAMTNKVVTTNSNTATGNAAISGTFSFGNSTSNATVNSTVVAITNSSANINISIPTTTQIANGQFYLNANGSWQTAAPVVSSVQTTGATLQPIDSFPMASYNAAEYLISVSDNNANNLYSSKIFVMHNKSNALVTEYAAIVSNSNVGVFSAAANSTHAILNFTPVSTNTNVKFTRTII